MNALTVSMLKEKLAYNPVTGEFLWSSSGAVAGTVTAEGYRNIMVDYVSYRSGRLAWLYVHGEWPVYVIDHKDRDRGNDAIDNLRDTTRSGNNRNKKRGANNSSGLMGVTWRKDRGKWEATIGTGNGKAHLGKYSSMFDAACVRKTAELAHGYDPSHGELAL